MKEDYWSETEQEVIDYLLTSKKGLSDEEAKFRLSKYGYNELKRKWSVLSLFLTQFKSPLIWLLLVVSLVSIFFGELINSIIIITIVLISSLLSFFNEYHSERIIDDLNKKIAYKAIVIRNNEKLEIGFRELVEGDIVCLSIGSIIPADLRLIETKNLEVNEAALTGESIPVRKESSPLKIKSFRFQDISNYAFAGTVVSNGEGLGVVIATGERTQLGKISKELEIERPQTDFQKGITKFGNLLIKVILTLTLLIFLLNSLLKHDILTSLLFALAVAIGLTPDLLPAIITVGLSRGAAIMAKKEVITKRLISIEDFGNMDTLCTDKTGTLTEGKITLYDYFDFDNKVNDDILFYGMLCTSVITHGKKTIGNPIDLAIWQHSNEKLKQRVKQYKTIYELPFDYERKMMSTVVEDKNKVIFITKGATQSILNSCSKIYIKGRTTSISYYSKKIEKRFTELASQGLRVIAVAYKLSQIKDRYDEEDEKNLTFMGFITFSDMPKKTVKNSIEKLESLDINFKILTGDNEIVTRTIAEQVGIPIKRIVLGDEIDRLSYDKLRKLVEESNIFCKLTPLQKARIIKALKQNGHVVGYMGDGINDAPALHEADVGISVNTAVDVAKDASDLILLNKRLDILADGVIEGRKIYSNSIKYILMGTSSNFGNMLSVAIASIFLPFLPMLPIQVLLTNLLYDFSELTIPTDNVDVESIKKPKKFDISAIKKYMLFFGPISSLYDFLTFIVLLIMFNASMLLFRTGWFIESMATEVLVIFVIRTRKTPFYKSKPGRWVLFSSLFIVLLSAIIPFTPLGTLFEFTRPPLSLLYVLIIIVATYLIIVELAKSWFFKKYEL